MTAIACGCAIDSDQRGSESHAVDSRFRIAELLFADDFKADHSHWRVELESEGKVEARGGKLNIDVPAGCTVWFEPLLQGPILIEYDATVIRANGANDRVSDLNCFWMASDARNAKDFFATQRHGRFEEYNQLRGYYVGLGGNGNTTTRFRRYIGDKNSRPLRPQDDLRDSSDMITANVQQTLRLVACGNLIQFWRDDKRMFEMVDPAPYTSGHFGFRTTANHMEIRRFRVYRLRPVEQQP